MAAIFNISGNQHGVDCDDREFGLQFRAEMLTRTAPTSQKGIEKYLGSGMVKGISHTPLLDEGHLTGLDRTSACTR